MRPPAVELLVSVVARGTRWVGEGVEEYGVDAADPEHVLVRIDPLYFRPTEVRRVTELCRGSNARRCEARVCVCVCERERQCTQLD